MPFVPAKTWPDVCSAPAPYRPAGRLHVAAALVDGVCVSSLLWLALAFLWS